MTTREAKKLRLHIKFLSGDFLTNERRAIDQPALNPACSLCLARVPSIITTESTEHVLVSCRATSGVRSRLYPELMNTVAKVQPMSRILDKNVSPKILAQFITDCASFNLPTSVRIPVHNPGISEIYSVVRNWCYGIARERSRLLKQLSESKDDRRQ